jgi:hypothetical protein
VSAPARLIFAGGFLQKLKETNESIGCVNGAAKEGLMTDRGRPTIKLRKDIRSVVGRCAGHSSWGCETQTGEEP